MNTFAFPSISQYGPREYGMTLRDYFAGQALAGIAAHSGSHAASAYYARQAYEAADYMLQQREKK